MSAPFYFQRPTESSTGRLVRCDLCVYGGSSAGIIAAVSAARRGMETCLLVPGSHLGGLTSGGLGNTDIGNAAIIGGLAREFYRMAGQHYGAEEEWKFEPGVAASVFQKLLNSANVKPILYQYLEDVLVKDGRIHSIGLLGGLRVEAGYYIDATYEGDLMARSGVRYTVGREGNALYGELLNGVQMRETHQFEIPVDPWKKEGNPASGLLPGIDAGPPESIGSGDKRVQAYNFRMCLTRGPERIPFPKPDDYRPENYELLARYLRGGWRQLFRKFDAIRGGKTDTNNHGAVSTDFIGFNHDYPEADYAGREAIFQNHVNYQKGLMWFLCNDPRSPEDVRSAMSQWGLAADEFESSGHWPAQLYVREARRMVSDYCITEHDCRGYRRANDSIGCGAYAMDSHNCRRLVVDNRVLNEGDVQAAGFPPYPISYRSVIPPRGSVGNLFVPVCLSASHIAYGSVRMEPVFMVLGESCALAAELCHRRGCMAHDLSYMELRSALESARQILDLPLESDEHRQRSEVGIV